MTDDRFLEPLARWTYLTFFGKYYGSDQYVGMLIILVLAGVISAMLIWFIYAIIYEYIDRKKVVVTEVKGRLVDKRYQGEMTLESSGTAVVSTGNGVGVGLTSSTSHSPEKFIFFVDANRIYKVEVSMQDYFRYNTGATLTIAIRIGYLSKSLLDTQLVK